MENQVDRIGVTREHGFGRFALAAEGRCRALIVGITSDGTVPLTEDFDPWIAESAARPIIGLPSIPFEAIHPGAAAVDDRMEQLGARLAARLATEIGYQARELVPMKSEFAGGDSPRSPFFLAPLLRPTGWRSRVGFVPGVREIPLCEMRRYLNQCQGAGAVVSPHVRQGLVLAEEFFPQWACRRLGQALETVVETHRAQALANA